MTTACKTFDFDERIAHLTQRCRQIECRQFPAHRPTALTDVPEGLFLVPPFTDGDALE